MRESVFGLGYVGCVTAACLAKAGHEVIGVDVNGGKVAIVNGGTSPIVEPGLGELLLDVVCNRRLRATTSEREAIDATELALVCVGTPGHARGQLNVSGLEHVAREIGAALRERPKPYTVVLRSTVLPGTTDDAFAADAASDRHAMQAHCQRLGQCCSPDRQRGRQSAHLIAANDQLLRESAGRVWPR